MPFSDLRIQWVESSDFGPKSDDLGHRILKSDFIPSNIAKSDCISRPIFFRSKNKNQKLGIRSHNRRPQALFIVTNIPVSAAKSSRGPRHSICHLIPALVGNGVKCHCCCCGAPPVEWVRAVCARLGGKVVLWLWMY